MPKLSVVRSVVSVGTRSRGCELISRWALRTDDGKYARQTLFKGVQFTRKESKAKTWGGDPGKAIQWARQKGLSPPIEPRVLGITGPFSAEDEVTLKIYLGQAEFGICLEEDQAVVISVVKYYSEGRQGEAFVIFITNRPPQEKTPGRKTFVLNRAILHYLADGNLHIEIRLPLV